MKKTVSLIFAFLALGLELAIAIKTPSVEAVTACIFSAIIIAFLFTTKNTVTITDDAPKNGKRPVDKAMKLSSEIAPFITEKNGRISITVAKK